MIRRILLLTSLVLVAAAACDLKIRDLTLDITSSADPSVYKPSGGNITCCRCAASGCKAIVAECPPGHEPIDLYKPKPPKQMN